MTELKAPNWLRAFDIIFGLISVIISIVVLAFQDVAILTLIFILSLVLLVVGVARIFGGIFAIYLSGGMRALNVGIGIIAIVLGITAIVYTDFTIQLLIYIISFALLLNGVARLLIGGLAKVFPKWLRGFFVVVGLLTIGLSLVVFVFSELGFLALILMLSVTFMINGIARIVQGIIGTQEEEW